MKDPSKKNSIQISSENIFAYTYDDSIYIYPILEDKPGKCINILKGHGDIISTLIQIKSHLLASASWDKTIKIWDIYLEKNNCVKTFTGHRNQVNSLIKLNERILISGGRDNLIIIWDFQEEQIIAKVEEHKSMVNCLLTLDQDSFASVGLDKRMIIWNLKYPSNKKFPLIIYDDNSIIYSLKNIKGKRALVSGDDNGAIKIWDYDGTCHIKKMGHSFAVICLETSINEKILLSGGCDQVVNIWKICNNEVFTMDLLLSLKEDSLICGLIMLEENSFAIFKGNKYFEICFLKNEAILSDRKKIGFFDGIIDNLLKIKI